MKKTLKIDENTELTLSNNISWAMEYREQFGHDIIPDLLPILSAILSLLGDLKKTKNGKIAVEELDKDSLQEALISLAGFQFTDFLNLVWALAKAADDDTPEPRKWVKGFEVFPVDVIAPELFNLLLEGLVSTKNLPSLQLPKAGK